MNVTKNISLVIRITCLSVPHTGQISKWTKNAIYIAKFWIFALKLLDKQRQLIKPIVKRYSGEWLKELGDGLLLSFPTSIDAVNCAIFIQETVKDIDNLNLRIGIHQGEVVYSENDIFGDDVNIASRLEKFSPVGGIAISNRVNASLERNPKYKTSYIGSPILKGVSQSIKIFCIVSNNLPKSDLSNGLNKPSTSFLKNYLFPITGAILIILGGLFWLILPLLTLGFADGDKNYDKRIAVMYFDNRGDGEDFARRRVRGRRSNDHI